MSTSSTNTVRDHYLGIGYILLASLGFAMKGIFIKLAYALDGNIDAISLMAIRMLLSMPFFIAVAIFYAGRTPPEPIRKTDALHIIYLGFIGYYLSSFLDFTGLQYISAGLERLLLYLYPTFVVILSMIMVGRLPRRQELFALGLSYVGISLVFAMEFSLQGTEVITGSLIVIGAALSFAFYMIGSHKAILRIGPARFTAYSMLVASGMIFTHYLFSHGAKLFSMPLGFYGYGLALALFSTVLPSFMMNAGIRQIGASRTAVLTSVGPVLTLVVAWSALGEGISMVQIGGTVLILYGVYISGRH